ncbi:MAG: UDP-N-acetylmuramoyl-L-alanine--D-glutamate ligase [Actinobacteria bacterium]|nr:UDP-N-acetylmuramoyl-L-alanine--D-glutamate ligase [Actinomycetota bacterium]
MIPRPQIPSGPYLVVGLARSGQAAAQLLAGRGFEVLGVDAGHPSGADTLGDFGVDAHLDCGGLEFLDAVQTVIKSPGVPNQAPVIVAARAAGKTVLGEMELGWRFLPNRFVAVTGTNGKTTTTELLGEIFKAAGMSVVVAGNIGRPVCGLVGKIDPDATVVCEASSFQLEDTLEFAPECAVLLNLAPDHIDRHGTMDAYREAKLTMFARQRTDDVAVTGPTISFELPGMARKLQADPSTLDAANIAMRGAHNLENAAVAATAACEMGVPQAAIDAALATFTGVEHRMEDVATIDGVLYVNDSKATNVAAATVALESFDGGVHAILGGSLKGERFSNLRAPTAGACKGVYLIGQSATQLAEDLQDVGPPVHKCETLERALAEARAAAKPGDTVLLAPACASFDQFDNYEERGRSFKRLVMGEDRAGQA